MAGLRPDQQGPLLQSPAAGTEEGQACSDSEAAVEDAEAGRRIGNSVHTTYARLNEASVASAARGAALRPWAWAAVLVVSLMALVLLAAGRPSPTTRMAKPVEWLQLSHAEDAEEKCSAHDTECTHTKCCQGNDKCYRKNPNWAVCRASCAPGVHFDDPAFYQDPWSCEVVVNGSFVPTSPGGWPTQVNPMAPVDDVTSLGPPKVSGQHAGNGSRGAQANSTSAIAKVPAPPGPEPTMLCVSVTLPRGSELDLLRMQFVNRIAIFACNGWSVYSNESVVLNPGPPAILTEVFWGTMVCPMSHMYAIPMALNSEVFYHFWQSFLKAKRFLEYDWTVKLDADSCFMPSRLRAHLVNRNPRHDPAYINNCVHNLHGPVEAMSHKTMQLFSDGLQNCFNSLVGTWTWYGEDVWLRRCMKVIGAWKEDDFGIMREKACSPFQEPLPCYTGAAVYHPLKTGTDYLTCLHNMQQQDAR